MQYVKCLRGQTESPTSFTDNRFNEDDFLERVKNSPAMFSFHFCKAMAMFYNGYFRKAMTFIKKAEEYLTFVLGKFFYYFL